jgi:hypothetical protein
VSFHAGQQNSHISSCLNKYSSALDKRILTQHLPDPDLNNLHTILVDEKSIGPHHHYLTVVINGENGEVLHLAEGKKKESLESFFQKLTSKQIKKIKAVGDGQSRSLQGRCP